MLLRLRGSCLPDLGFCGPGRPPRPLPSRAGEPGSAPPRPSPSEPLPPSPPPPTSARAPRRAVRGGGGTVQPHTSRGPHLAGPVLGEAERFVQLSELGTEGAMETPRLSHVPSVWGPRFILESFQMCRKFMRRAAETPVPPPPGLPGRPHFSPFAGSVSVSLPVSPTSPPPNW